MQKRQPSTISFTPSIGAYQPEFEILQGAAITGETRTEGRENQPKERREEARN